MIWPLLILLAIPSFAGSPAAFTTAWVCPTENRGNMPERRAVTVSYDENGNIKFRPDIFAADPFDFFKSIFRKRRSSSAVSECVNSFMAGLEAPLIQMRNQCANVDASFCSKSDEDIRNDVGQKIRGSNFYRRYQSDLVSAEEALGTPRRTTPVVTNPNPNPGGTTVVSDGVPNGGGVTPQIATVPPRIPVSSSVLPPARPRTPTDDTASDAALRARTLDYMVDNYSLFTERTRPDAPQTKFQLFRSACPDLGATTGQSGPWCRQTWGEYNRFIGNLTPMLSRLKGREVSQDEVLANLECLPQEGQFNDIEGLLRGLDRAPECTPIEPGGFRRFPVGKTNHHNYLLKRNASGNYEATIVMNFNYQSGTENAEAMQARANNCYQQFAPYLKTPSGESLGIRMINPSEANALSAFERPPTINAVIVAGNDGTSEVRGNTATYTDHFRCETILHETLHYLGLCDEYREMDNTKRYNAAGAEIPSMAEEWSCRVVPEFNTIMSSHTDALRSTVPLRYSCRCQDDSCRNTLAGSDENARNMRAIMEQPSSYQLFAGIGSKCRPIFGNDIVGYPNSNPDKRVVIHSEDPSNFVFENRQLISIPGSGLSTGRGFQRCDCQGDASCINIVRRGVESVRRGTAIVNSCPEHTTPVNSDGPLRFSPGAVLAGENEETQSAGDVLNIVTRPENTNRAILAPNHLNRIVFGNCNTGPAASYNRCAEFATIARGDANCAENRQNMCSDRDYLGVEVQ